MKTKNLSSSQFADKIGVPRSGLSHVIKGRNKPSLDYVLRILKSFPEIDSNWLLTGEITALKGYENAVVNALSNSAELSLKTALKSEENIAKNNDVFTHGNDSKISNLEDRTLINQEEMSLFNKNNIQDNSKNNTSKKVEKIVFFYSDGSFEEYKN